jgi:inner membrane protein
LLPPEPVFLAHIPAGYLLTKRIEARQQGSGLMPLGLAASVLPDLDLVRFYVFDHRRVLHHEYWTHIPFWWATIAAAWLLGLAVVRRRTPGAASAVFFGNVFLHLVLDTFVGGVAWLAPFSRHAFALVSVPTGHRWWVWNFVLHWTFTVELLLAAWAAFEAARPGDVRPGANLRQWKAVRPT